MNYTAAVRRRARALPELFSVQPSEARMQDRIQFQASRQALEARRNGEGD